MKRMVLFEDSAFANLLPLTYWRTTFELRSGRLSLAERLGRFFGVPASALWTRAWIADVASERFSLPINTALAGGDLLLNARWLPDPSFELPPGPFVGTCEGAIACVMCDEKLASALRPEDFLDRGRWTEVINRAPHQRVSGKMIEYPWTLVQSSADLLLRDWAEGDAEVAGQVHPSAVLVEPSHIRIEADAHVGPLAVLDASSGPIVVETGARIGSHVCIAGPAHVGRQTTIHPHAYIHGGTSLGPVCKVGGEIDACVFQGYTNKAHAGFLGHAYVGSWVNIGAETTNSDLKNTYGTIRVPINGQEVDSGEMFFGCVIGDHVKTGIQQAISTGSVLGFACNVAGSRILPRFVRSFTWMTDRGVEVGDAARLALTAAKAMERRGQELTDAEMALFEKLPKIVEFFEPDLAPQRGLFDSATGHVPEPVPELEKPGLR